MIAAVAPAASAALDERDLSAHRRGEVGGLAAAVGRVDVDRDDRPRDVARARVAHVLEVGAVDVGRRVGGELLERRRTDQLVEGEVEGLARDGVAGGLQPLLHVVGGGGVAREPRRAVAAVLVGDRLQRREVLVDTLDGDTVHEFDDGVAGGSRGGWCGWCGCRGRGSGQRRGEGQQACRGGGDESRPAVRMGVGHGLPKVCRVDFPVCQLSVSWTLHRGPSGAVTQRVNPWTIRAQRTRRLRRSASASL
jgi:hypothetical protein